VRGHRRGGRGHGGAAPSATRSDSLVAATERAKSSCDPSEGSGRHFARPDAPGVASTSIRGLTTAHAMNRAYMRGDRRADREVDGTSSRRSGPRLRGSPLGSRQARLIPSRAGRGQERDRSGTSVERHYVASSVTNSQAIPLGLTEPTPPPVHAIAPGGRQPPPHRREEGAPPAQGPGPSLTPFAPRLRQCAIRGACFAIAPSPSMRGSCTRLRRPSSRASTLHPWWGSASSRAGGQGAPLRQGGRRQLGRTGRGAGGSRSARSPAPGCVGGVRARVLGAGRVRAPGARRALGNVASDPIARRRGGPAGSVLPVR